MIRLIYLLLLAFSFTNAAAHNQQRLTKLTHEIRCIVCQNQSIADSEAPLAKDLRQKIASMIENQASDADIKDYLVKRYGESILLNPRLTPATLFLWLFPFFSLGVIAWLCYRKNMIR